MLPPKNEQALKPRPFTSTLIKNIVYPLWTLRDHPAYLRYARIFKRTQYLSQSALEQHQVNLLRKQLTHVYCNIPFYRDRMVAVGVTPLDIRSVSDLKLLPILTKREIQDHREELLAQNVPLNRRRPNQTGGSTGQPLQFWVDKERFDSRRASTDRHNAWAGILPGDWCAYLWGSRMDTGPVPRLDWRERFLHRRLTLNTSVFSNADLDRYIALIRKVRPKFLVAYAQSAAMFANYVEQTGARDIHFDSIVTSAEVLMPDQRDLIERVFRGRVFNRYGCRELSVIASECEYHAGMHVNADALIIEIDPLPGLPEGTGRVLATDLFNRSMPLIRYEIGDLASWTTSRPCGCSRVLPRIEKIEGRITDFLKMSDNTTISGISLALLVGQIAEIRQAQFVQRSRNDILLRVVPGRAYGSNTVMELHNRLDPYLRGLANLSILCVESIPLEPSGKFRFVKVEMPAERLTYSTHE
jgi:phenylacetate-CoA ligase